MKKDTKMWTTFATQQSIVNIFKGNAWHFYRDVNYEAISEEQFFSRTLTTFLIPLDPRNEAEKRLQRAILRRPI